ncbi:DUF3592 domain-containing protein [Actinocorallia sp. B10E7]|uniref:DUF3592 domain-containing protein n=1 Tax=Actinocorallia sp. B10E7 TaxID=3153558 RepID=UPI00325D131F
MTPIAAMDPADAVGIAFLLGIPAMIFALVSVLLMWGTVSAQRLDRVAVLAPEPGKVVKEDWSGGEQGSYTSYIRFTTAEGEEVETKIVTNRSVSGPEHELRMKYDPKNPRRAAIVRERDDNASIGASVTCGAIALVLVFTILVIVF